MSNLVINAENDKGQVKNVVFAYVKLQDGAYKYGCDGDDTQKEYTVDCIVDKPTYKAFKKAYPKNSAKEIDTPDFKNKFKIDPVFPDKDEQFVIKLKANANMRVDFPKADLRVGDAIPYTWNSRPKVFEPSEDGKGVVDVTMKKLVANGSKGTVGFKINENKYGSFPQLTGILVTEMIEYELEGGGGDTSDFGVVVGGFDEGDGEVKQKASTEMSDEDAYEVENEAQEANVPEPPVVQEPSGDLDLPF